MSPTSTPGTGTKIWHPGLLWLVLAGLWHSTGAQKNIHWETERYDGWYNNLMYHAHNTAGSQMARLLPANFADGVYQALKEPQVPNARELSNLVAKGNSGLPSKRNITALGVFFGFHLLSEILETYTVGCPAEFLNMPIPLGDPMFDPSGSGDIILPFQRMQWAFGTGRSPNSPRAQTNGVTGWLDGSAIYGSSHSWSDSLRSFFKGRLLNGTEDMPKQTEAGSLMWKALDPSSGRGGPHGIFNFGSSIGNENLFLQAVSIVWFRYHNQLTVNLSKLHPDWTDEDLFQHARKWVIAIYQNIVLYEWLPIFLEKNVTSYTGYKQHVDARLSPEFVVSSAVFLGTMVPPGVYMRNQECVFRKVTNADGSSSPALRLCNSYWDRENPNLQKSEDLDELLLGMSSQIAEKEDSVVVEDLRVHYQFQATIQNLCH